MGKAPGIRCIGFDMQFALNGKDSSSIKKKIGRSHPLRSFPACCISKAIVMRLEEIIYLKIVCVTSTSTDKFPTKDNWMCDLDSDVAGSSKDTQPKLRNPIVKYGETPYVDQSPTKRN